MLDSFSGDLTKDAYKDLVLILQHKNDSDTTIMNRPLLLLKGDGKGLYTLIAKNDSLVLCRICGGMMGDPYQAIAIKNGYFTIEHYGGSSWRWTRYFTFKFNVTDQHFYLHRDAGESFHASFPEKVEQHVYNKEMYGKVKFENYRGVTLTE